MYYVDQKNHFVFHKTVRLSADCLVSELDSNDSFFDCVWLFLYFAGYMVTSVSDFIFFDIWSAMKQYHLASILGVTLLILVSAGINQYNQHSLERRIHELEKSRAWWSMSNNIATTISQWAFGWILGSNSWWLESVQQQLMDVIETNKKSVVSIIQRRDLIISRGDPFGQRIVRERRSAKVWGWSGIITTSGGLIITNKHVVSDLNSQYTVVLYDGTMLDVQNIRLDPILDLAVIQIQATTDWSQELTPANFMPMWDMTKVWQIVIAIGNALAEYENSATRWIISAKQRQLESDGESVYVWLLQTDTTINPGNSGGPLINIYGQIIWMNTAMSAEWDGIGFAIPLSDILVKTMIESINNNQQLVRPFLGVNYVDLSNHISKQFWAKSSYWALILEVWSDTPASRAWLLSWDIIISINNTRLDRQYPLLYELYTHQAQSTIALDVLRDDRTIQIPVTLGRVR